MAEFSYRITLDSGSYAIAHNGIELDRLVSNRWQRVKSIEVLPHDSPEISEPASHPPEPVSMLDYETREAQAIAIYQQGLQRVKDTPEPKGQQFPNGSRVRIKDDLGPSMSHFESGVEATVENVYAHAYGGSDVKSYRLNIDGRGSVAWYYEHQLEAI